MIERFYSELEVFTFVLRFLLWLVHATLAKPSGQSQRYIVFPANQAQIQIPYIVTWQVRLFPALRLSADWLIIISF